MKNRFIVVYTVFAAAIFIFSLSFFGYSLYNEYTSNKKQSTEDFNQLVTDIRTISNKYTENTSTFSEELKKSIKNPQKYAFIEVKRDNQTILLYPAGKTKQDTASNMTRSFELSLTIENNILVVNCNRYLIQPDSIFYYARISFLMILIITLITIIMIIYLNLSENKTSIAEEIETDSEDELSFDDDITSENTNDSELPEDSEITEDQISQETTTSSGNDTTQKTTIEQEAKDAQETTIEQEKQTAQETTNSQETATSEYGAFNAPEPEPIQPVELPIKEVKPASEASEVSKDNPSGLYNPETEIGWESYLLPRLNNEIDRATASEIDLAIFEFKLPDLTKNNEDYVNVCRYLTLQFQFKDLLFEYKEDSIIAIKISMNIDSAIPFADKLYSDIRNIINSKNCYIGISSRSIRIVTAERLLLEADQAVIHAIEDKDSPIVAFRVDSDKYRQMIESASVSAPSEESASSSESSSSEASES